METIIENLKKCPRFNRCSANVCPADPEVNLRNRLPDEERCPFTINKRARSQKGIKTLVPNNVLEVIPELNVEILHKRNQKRWHKLKDHGKE